MAFIHGAHPATETAAVGSAGLKIKFPIPIHSVKISDTKSPAIAPCVERKRVEKIISRPEGNVPDRYPKALSVGSVSVGRKPLISLVAVLFHRDVLNRREARHSRVC